MSFGFRMLPPPPKFDCPVYPPYTPTGISAPNAEIALLVGREMPKHSFVTPVKIGYTFHAADHPDAQDLELTYCLQEFCRRFW